jgi:hypothetical protein
MPADPTPAPEWAVKMVASFESKGEHPLAELLASVRDAALREAAGLFVGDKGLVSGEILALVGSAPKQTEKESPRG